MLRPHGAVGVRRPDRSVSFGRMADRDAVVFLQEQGKADREQAGS